jgi:hypothetical protein
VRALSVVIASWALVLSACTSIPAAGPVLSAEINTGSGGASFDFLPPGPSAGATQQEIVAGFIAAGTAAQDNYRVARSYLATEAQERWNPSASALIRAGEPLVTLASGTALTYAVPVSAEIDEFGRYLAVSADTPQELRFRLVQERGQWRISEAPDGIMLSETAFSEAFSSYRLYFFSSGYRELVADVRWFASRGEVSTKIVRALLAEPSFWLDQGATVSAFPEGTQLALTPIPVSDGVARVDLTTSVLRANELTRQRMLLQLNASLSQVQGIASSRISINQNELVIPPLEDAGPTLASGRDARLAVLLDRRFGFLQAGQVERIDGISDQVANLAPTAIFYSAAFDQALVTREDGVWRAPQGGEAVLLDARPGLIRPIVDSCGFVWSAASESGPEMVRIYSQTGGATILPLELGQDARLVSFELARDDTRLLLLVQTETGVRVLLTAVTRSEECVPQSIGEFVELGPLAGNAVDAAWIDDARVAVVVVDQATGVGDAFVFDTSGRSRSLGRPSRPVALVGGIGGVSGLRLLAENGSIYQPRGNGWQATGDIADLLVTQR